MKLGERGSRSLFEQRFYFHSHDDDVCWNFGEIVDAQGKSAEGNPG